MKYRCPYCKQVFGPEPASKCPHCGKVMRVPDESDDGAEENGKRRKGGGKDESDASAPGGIAGLFFSGRQPMIMIGVMLLVLVMALLMSRGKSDPRDQGLVPDGRISTAERNVDILRKAAEMFRQDCGRYPLAGEGLAALRVDPGVQGWKGPYIDFLRPDPWRLPYCYACTNRLVMVFSSGPDGIPNTGDDVVAQEPVPGEVDRIRGNPVSGGQTNAVEHAGSPGPSVRIGP